MFKSGFQGGPSFEVFSTQGRDAGSNWKIPSSGVKRLYEKEVKGYVFSLEGAPATTKMITPKDSKSSLTLVQRFLVVQLYLSKGADFSMEIGITDLGNNKRRLFLSSAQKEIQVTPLHAKMPLYVVHRAVWLNLVLDMVSLVGETWTNQTFRSTDQITISANCKLKRVFTMKAQPPDTTDDDEVYNYSSVCDGERDSIPKQYQLIPDVTQHTQLLTYGKIRCGERARSGKHIGPADQSQTGPLDLDLNASVRKGQTSDVIAFGTKAPRPLDSGRKSGKQGTQSSRSVRSQVSRQGSVSSRDDVASGAGGDHVVSHTTTTTSSTTTTTTSQPTTNTTYNRQQSEPSPHDKKLSVLNSLSENGIVAPHPPRAPSTDRFRRRPRVKSVGQNRLDPNVSSPPTSALISESRSQVWNPQPKPKSADSRLTSSDTRDSGVGPDVPEIQSPRKGEITLSKLNPRDSVSDVISLLKDELGAGLDLKDYPSKKTEDQEPRDNNQDSNKTMHELTENDVLVRRNDDLTNGKKFKMEESVVSRSASASEGSQPGEYEESDDERSGESELHLFISPPKSAAPRRAISPGSAALVESDSSLAKKNFVKTFRSTVRKASESNRGARLEDDFVSRSSSDEDMKRVGQPQRHRKFNHISSFKQSRTHLDQQNRAFVKNSSYNADKYISSRNKTSNEESVTNMNPPVSNSPEQKTGFDPSVYADSESRSQNGVRVSGIRKSSLREIKQPQGEFRISSQFQKSYDHTKYEMKDMTDSFEARMFASMRRQGEECLEDVEKPTHLSRSIHGHPSSRRSGESVAGVQHACSESPATTSDDDTSYSTWKPPSKQKPHNYLEEMTKARRSSDTLGSSNPQDWSGAISPPITDAVKDLHGTLEGIPDDIIEDRSGEKIVQEGNDEDKIYVHFDSNLNCYYDPITEKYYELK